MNHLVTFASADMTNAADLCILSALANGIGGAKHWHPGTLQQTSFYRDNETLLSQPRGCGYWAWKPFIINERLNNDLLAEGDILIYSDVGIDFINNVSHIIDRMDQDIFLFGNNWEHAHWCKRDIVEEIWPLSLSLGMFPNLSQEQWFHEYDNDQLTWERFGKQVQASVIFFRVSDYTRKFVKEWLDWCLFEGGRLIDDSPSRTPNHPEFQENRHDQAILTTMAYREGIKLHWWPAIYNDGQFTYEKLPVYAIDDYPPIFHHHRRRNHEWKQVA